LQGDEKGRKSSRFLAKGSQENLKK